VEWLGSSENATRQEFKEPLIKDPPHQFFALKRTLVRFFPILIGLQPFFDLERLHWPLSDATHPSGVTVSHQNTPLDPQKGTFTLRTHARFGGVVRRLLIG
jgi:hypothetical protein